MPFRRPKPVGPSITTSISRNEWLVLSEILLLALVLRTIHASSQGLWFDEGLTLPLARWSLHDLFLLPTDPTPPLYYVLHKFLIPPDAPLIAIRGISIAAGLISVGLMFALGRLTLGTRAGLVCAGLLAVWPLHVDYSQEARAYSLLFMFTLLGGVGVATYAKVKRPRRRWAGLAMLVAGNVLAFYTHLTSVFWIAATSLLVLGYAVHRRRPWTEIAVAYAAMALLAVPGVYRLWVQAHSPNPFTWLKQSDPMRFIYTLGQVLLPTGLWENPWLTASQASWAWRLAVLAAAALLALGVWRSRRDLKASAAVPLIVAYLLMPFVLWGEGFVAQPVYMARTALFVAPGFILLIALLCTDRPIGSAVAIGLGGVYLAGTLLYGVVREKEDMPGVVRFLEASSKPDDVVVVCSMSAYPALRYHVSKPIGAAVLGVGGDGELVRLEGPLGSTPDWVGHYFDVDLARQLDPAPAERPFIPLLVIPGQTVWQIDNHCPKAAKVGVDTAFTTLGLAGAKVWSQTDRKGSINVAVWRYDVERTVALPALGAAETSGR